MFFIGLTSTLILTIAGCLLLIQSSFVTGGVLVGSGMAVFVPFVNFYRSKSQWLNEEEQKKKEEDEPFWADCLDCSSLSMPMPDCKPESSGEGGSGFDCDCSPDCSP